jgi:predicted membrane-bound mannosyltransferase
MIRKYFRRKRLILGLAVATAFAAPVSAQAMVIIDGPSGGESSYVIPSSSGNTVVSPAQSDAAYQLKVEAMRGQALNNAYQLKVDAMRGQQLNKTWAGSVNQTPVVSSTSTSDGFNWSDAGIGAAVTFGVVLFLLTAVGLGRKHRGRMDRSGLARA